MYVVKIILSALLTSLLDFHFYFLAMFSFLFFSCLCWESPFMMNIVLGQSLLFFIIYRSALVIFLHHSGQFYLKI